MDRRELLFREDVFAPRPVAEGQERRGHGLDVHARMGEGAEGDMVVDQGFAARLQQGMDAAGLGIESAIVQPQPVEQIL